MSTLVRPTSARSSRPHTTATHAAAAPTNIELHHPTTHDRTQQQPQPHALPPSPSQVDHAYPVPAVIGESFPSIGGFLPSAPSFDLAAAQQPLLQQPTQSDAGYEMYNGERVYQVEAIPYVPPTMNIMTHQPVAASASAAASSSLRPIQMLTHPVPFQSNHPPTQLHPITVAAVESIHARTAAEERKAYLRSKALAAERREAAEAAAAAAAAKNSTRTTNDIPLTPVVTPIRHLVLPSDDLTELAVRYGTSEAQIKSHNRRIVFRVLDNVVGQHIIIPATCGFQQQDIDPDAIANERELNRQFHLVEEFQSRTNCTKQEAEFYLEENQYHLTNAMNAYEADLSWESQQKSSSSSSSSSTVMRRR